jgi:glycyl-tRNA synthetase beta chain
MLTGFWAIDEKPTGSKDPFALRRAALGVIRVLLETGTRLSLTLILTNSLRYSKTFAVFVDIEREAVSFSEYLKEEKQSNADMPIRDTRNIRDNLAFKNKWNDYQYLVSSLEYISQFGVARQYRDDVERMGDFVSRGCPDLRSDLLAFLADRLKVALRDKGIRHDVIDACFRLGGQDDLTLLVRRVEALQAFLATEDGANLLAGFRRAANIVAKAEAEAGPTVKFEGAPEPRLFREAPEQALFAALEDAEPRIAAALNREDFAAAMRAMAALRAPIDAFLDGVVVNAPDRATRFNRLCLLNRVREVMGQVAVFGAVEG